jgi:hypothetical protein
MVRRTEQRRIVDGRAVEQRLVPQKIDMQQRDSHGQPQHLGPAHFLHETGRWPFRELMPSQHGSRKLSRPSKYATNRKKRWLMCSESELNCTLSLLSEARNNSIDSTRSQRTENRSHWILPYPQNQGFMRKDKDTKDFVWWPSFHQC